MKEESEIPVYAKLLFDKDVNFFVDGKPASPGQILALAEESDYMADYVPGKEGKIAEVRFDRIHPA